jgi:hypothetical protein
LVREALAEPLVAPDESADATLVLLSYKRPQNLELQAHLALRCPRVRRIVISHNAPGRRRPRCPDDPRIRWVIQPRESGPVTRYQVVRDESTRFFVAIDDDLFLSPAQISELVAHLSADPDVVHGIYGQRDRAGAFVDNLTRIEDEVDILNRVYAFTDVHLGEYFRLLDEVGLSSFEELRRLDDDLVLAFSGSGRPKIHDLGPFCDCPSERRRGVALWRRKNAGALRRELFERLRRLKPLG